MIVRASCLKAGKFGFDLLSISCYVYVCSHSSEIDVGNACQMPANSCVLAFSGVLQTFGH